jgi:hypothetical protein
VNRGEGALPTALDGEDGSTLQVAAADLTPLPSGTALLLANSRKRLVTVQLLIGFKNPLRQYNYRRMMLRSGNALKIKLRLGW